MPVIHVTRSPLVATVVMDLLVNDFAVAAIWSNARVSRVAVLWPVPYAT
jgi:hypothetical protein